MIEINSYLRLDNIKNDIIDEFDLTLHLLRLDLIHPVVSGNKLYKLHYFIELAKHKNAQRLITYGGAYSNHLIATAYYANQIGLKSAAIVRGEEPANWSHTLLDCKTLGMDLHFVERKQYDEKKSEVLLNNFSNEELESSIIIPEGGYAPHGSKGISLLFETINHYNPSHLCSAIGTATTFAGLVGYAEPSQQIIGVPVLKNMNDIDNRLSYLLEISNRNNFVIFNDYHFNGYAKYDETLIRFMNQFYLNHNIPLDFVYTGKMMFGIFDQIKSGYFPKGSKIICLHTGGLQGNLSLPKGTLVF